MKNEKFYYYKGSNSNPPCEKVEWVVMSEDLKINEEQLSSLKSNVFMFREYGYNSNRIITTPTQPQMHQIQLSYNYQPNTICNFNPQLLLNSFFSHSHPLPDYCTYSIILQSIPKSTTTKLSSKFNNYNINKSLLKHHLILILKIIKHWMKSIFLVNLGIIDAYMHTIRL